MSSRYSNIEHDELMFKRYLYLDHITPMRKLKYVLHLHISNSYNGFGAASCSDWNALGVRTLWSASKLDPGTPSSDTNRALSRHLTNSVPLTMR
jgi:hypothetical protein